MRLALLLICCQIATAAMREVPLRSEFEGTTFAGTLVYDDASPVTRPALLMVPNWMGPSANGIEKARLIADLGYVVYLADVYGIDVRPSSTEEARAAATLLRSDRPLLRRRVAQQLQLLRDQAGMAPINPAQVAAIGFCFGGGAVLELARSGAELAAVVSFHGNLDTPDPSLAAQIRCKVLVCHGADDPGVPREQVNAFLDEMQAAAVDFQLIAYGGAVHSFTNPEAATPGRSQYHPLVAQRSYAAMQQLFDECFTPPPP